MTITLPTICVSFDGFGTVLMIAFIAFAAGYWIAKVRSDREWEADIRRKVSQQIQAPWLCEGEPVVIPRVDKALAVWREHPYRELPSFDWRDAA